MEVKDAQNVENSTRTNRAILASTRRSISLSPQNIKCRWKGCPENIDANLHLHHLIPKSIGGTDMDGRRRLCKYHHAYLHNLMPQMILRVVPAEYHQKIKDEIKRVSLGYMEK